MNRDDRRIGVFDRAANTYGRVGPDFFSHYGTRLVELVTIEPGSRVLDVAAGTGASALAAAGAAGATASVFAGDISHQMLRRLQLAARVRGLTNIRVAQMDAQHLALRSEVFDCVMCGFALNSFSSPEDALGELHRALRAGGRFACSVSPWWWWEGDQDWEWHASLLESLGVATEGSRRYLGDPKALQGVLAAGGFEEPVCSVQRFELSFIDRHEWWEWAWSHGYRSVLEVMTPTQLARYKAECFEALERSSGQPIHGRLEVCLAVARKAP